MSPAFLKMVESIRTVIKEKIAAEFELLRTETQHVLKGLSERIDAIQLIPGPAGRDGVDGKDGKDGEKGERGEVGLIGPMGREGFNGKDGKDGVDGIHGKDGRDGIDGKDGAPGLPGPMGPPGAMGPSGKDGAEGLPGPKGEPGQRGEPGPAGKDGLVGAPGVAGTPGIQGEKGDPGLAGRDGLDGNSGRDGIDGKDGRDGRDGRDGDPGRDALAIDVQSAMDATKSYPRGTFVCFRGGLLRANRNTDPVNAGTVMDAGWDVIVNGISDIQFGQMTERNFFVEIQSTSGVVALKEFSVPAMLYQGVFEKSRSYERGDVVNWAGSAWHAMETPTRGVPGEEQTDWKLIVKRGRDGKDGKDGKAGPEGKKGRDSTEQLKERFQS